MGSGRKNEDEWENPYWSHALPLEDDPPPPEPLPPGDEGRLIELIALWRETKDPELAKIIDAFSKARESADAKAIRSRKRKVDADEWSVLAERLPVLDRGALLVSFADATTDWVRHRLGEVEAWDHDPRVADKLHEFVANPPWGTSASRTIWTHVFSLLRDYADPRSLRIAERFEAERSRSSEDGRARWLGDNLQRLVAAVDKAPEPRALKDQERAELHALCAELHEPSNAASRRSAEEQLAFVLEHPEDDEARLVLADMLQERGDPRGELIALQILAEEGPLDRKQRRREKELLNELHHELLGPLAPMVMKRGLTIRRGFIEGCELKDNVHASQLAAAAESNVGATLRYLAAPLPYVLAPGLGQLREVRVKELRGTMTPLEELFQRDTPLPFESLDVYLEDGQTWLLDGCRSLPQLRRLTLRGMEREVLHGASRELAKNVSELCFDELPPLTFAREARSWLAPGRRTRRIALCARSWIAGHWRATVAVEQATADGGERVAQLELSRPGAPYAASLDAFFDFIAETLHGLRPLDLARVEVKLLKPIQDERQQTRLEESLARGTTAGTPVVFIER